MNHKKKISIAIIVSLVLALFLIFIVNVRLGNYDRVKHNSSKNVLNLNKTDYGVGDFSSTSQGFKKYSNDTIGLSFLIPDNWNLDSNNLGHGVLRFTNFSPDVNQTIGFNRNQNKIEAVIGSNTRYISSGGYPDEKIIQNKIIVSGFETNRADVQLDKSTSLRTYYFANPKDTSKVLTISIFGDPENFYILDYLVRTITWVK